MSIKKYFGTDGIRGRVGSNLLNAEFMLKLGWSAGKVLAKRESPVVLIGKDTRISGYMLESALQAGFSSAGVDTFLLGVMPTPAIAYLTHSMRASAGVVLSASHNPYYDNGVKFFNSKGFKLTHKTELAIEEQVDSPMHTVSSAHLGKATRLNDAAGRYIEFCKSTFPSNLNLKGLRIVVDCANGACYSVAPQIFFELGAKVKTLANQPDGFNINRDCGATDTAFLQKSVIQAEANIGIALDGDGDRVIMIDEFGSVVDGDELLGVIATHVDNPLGVVGTSMSNFGLERMLSKKSIPFHRANVGDRSVLEALLARGWQLGGEPSGHIVNLRHTTTGDGIVSALQILSIMQQTGKSLSKLRQVVTKQPQVMINVKCDVRKTDVCHIPEIQAEVDRMQNALADRGRILLRASGTEPLIRVMVEGKDENEVNTVAKKLSAFVASTLNAICV